MTFQGYYFPWKIVFSTSPEWHFRSAKGQNEFSRLGDTLNNRFLELKKVTLLYAKEDENYIVGIRTTRIISSITSLKSHFGLCRRQKIYKLDQATTWNILFRTRANRVFWWWRGTKWVLTDRPFLYASLNRHPPNRILGCVEKQKMNLRRRRTPWNISLSQRRPN
jgi:hypothetical protein